MKTTRPILISVPEPCSENWGAMSEKEQGRFCSSCQKTVIDFSSFTDQELFSYFKNAETIPCGRFHNSQLNKPLEPSQKRPPFLLRYYRAVATLFGFLALRNETTASVQKPSTTVSPLPFNNAVPSIPVKNNISGTVKDKAGNLLENAEILLEEKIVATTDKNGYFSFEVPETLNKSVTLLIRHTNMIAVVRNYHPAMQSTSYDIQLLHPEDYSPGHTMGVPMMNEEVFPTIPIVYNQNDKALSADIKAMLAVVAGRMRNNPGVMIYIKSGNRQAELPTNKKMQALVKKYLVDQEGISEERLKPVLSAEPLPYTIELTAKEE